MSTRRLGTAEKSGRARERVLTHTVHHSGCSFRVTEEMAGIFFRRATAVLAEAGAELVPLSHAGGVDLLLIASETVWSVTRIEVGIGRTSSQPGSTNVAGLRAAS